MVLCKGCRHRLRVSVKETAILCETSSKTKRNKKQPHKHKQTKETGTGDRRETTCEVGHVVATAERIRRKLQRDGAIKKREVRNEKNT